MKSDLLKSSYMKPRGVNDHPWQLLTPYEVSIRVLLFTHDHWFLMFFLWFSCVLMWGSEVTSHMNHSRFILLIVCGDSPPGGKFQKSGGPHARGGKTSFLHVFYCQIVSKWRILHSDCDDFRRRFHLCPPHVLNQSAGGRTQPRFCQNLEISIKSDFLKSNYMKSRGVNYHSSSLLSLQEVSIRVLVHF